MPGPFIHNIDPIFANVGGIYLWWYGLSYTLGFLETLLYLKRARSRLGMTASQAYDLTISVAAGILLGGRTVEVVFYEWPFYKRHPALIPACWLGGMSTHGVLLGAVVGTWLFCRMYRKSFFRIADALAIPGAFLMGMGRIGNFIDGQIVGSVTDVWWAVKFPDAEGFRHPVVLYDGVKNLLLIPLLLYVQKRRPAPGVAMAHFIFWYGFLRIFVDIFREYPTHLLGIATGQSFNIFMALLGGGLLFRLSRGSRRLPESEQLTAGSAPSPSSTRAALWPRRIALAALLLFPLSLPSDWTQDIPARYGKRHPGLRYSLLYPQIR